MTGAPISDVEFFITDSDGSMIGNANGKYVTDSAGTIRIDGLTPGMTVIAKRCGQKTAIFWTIPRRASRSSAMP